MAAMALGELTDGLDGARLSDGAAAIEIGSLAYDSREARPGSLFFCVSGFQSDGHSYAPQAVENGAAALVAERPLGLGVPEVLVPSARVAMAPLAARFYGEPARELRVAGVTGTNGKTTTAYLVRALLEAAGVQCGLLGTVKSVIGGQDRAVARTTPEAIDLQVDLSAMLAAGDRACAIEVSSHALALSRTDAIPFAAAVFTNLTQDHLDFHPTMEDYFLAKRLLFLPEHGEPPAASVVNVADPYGKRLADELDDAITFAVEAEADYMATGLRCDHDGCRFLLRTGAGEQAMMLPMPGRFNVANALGALAAAHAMGAPPDVLIEALEVGVRVPGRFEPVDEGQDFAVLVDYAHTPDSLENVLRSARELLPAGGRVICVFGAGGDRDRGKRPLMGSIAVSLAEEVIVTSDNPRSEDPEAIIAEIFTGIHDFVPERHPGGGYTANGVPDRRAAIEFAVADAHPGDVVVIAGKGHEQGQEFEGGRKLPFDDVTVAREALKARAQGLPVGAR
jgi:UDP-N-acetylmuramoyl-L-alanyl-D-glutamate--2,6-diaminopimelate ligase